MKRLVVIFMMLGGLVFADWQVITDVDAMTDEQSVMYVYMEETFPILAINIKPNNPTVRHLRKYRQNCGTQFLNTLRILYRLTSLQHNELEKIC